MSSRWLQVLVVTSLGMAVLEFVDAFQIDVPAAAIVFGLAYLGGAWWLFRSVGIWPACLLGFLNLVELAFLPGYTRETTIDWVMQGLVVVLAAPGLVAAIAVVRSRRSARKQLRTQSA